MLSQIDDQSIVQPQQKQQYAQYQDGIQQNFQQHLPLQSQYDTTHYMTQKYPSSNQLAYQTAQGNIMPAGQGI